MNSISQLTKGNPSRSFYSLKERFLVTNSPSEAEVADSYALRNEVFCDELNWVAKNGAEEIDEFDSSSSQIVIVFEGSVIGHLRIHPKFSMWMTTEIFGSAIPDGLNVRNIADADISRLAIKRDWRSFRLENGETIASMLYDALYTHCMLCEINTVSMIVSPTVLRCLKMQGLPVVSYARREFGRRSDTPTFALLNWAHLANPLSCRQMERAMHAKDMLTRANFEAAEEPIGS